MSERPGYRIGYCTAGLTLHRLEDALHLIAESGYRGVFLTLDVHHLDPFDSAAPKRVTDVARLLESLDLQPVVETGARFLLDPRLKHQPTLLSTKGFERRIELIEAALRIARDLGADAISMWSGTPEEDASPAEAWERLTSRLAPLVALADRLQVQIGFEPEPGMLVETVDDYHDLRARLGEPKALGLSLDCGHLLVTGEDPPHHVLSRERDHLVAVAIEDMRRGIHEHLPFGEGDLDLNALVATLNGLDDSGVVAVELGRHAHEGPTQLLAARHTLEPLGVPFRSHLG